MKVFRKARTSPGRNRRDEVGHVLDEDGPVFWDRDEGLHDPPPRGTRSGGAGPGEAVADPLLADGSGTAPAGHVGSCFSACVLDSVRRIARGPEGQTGRPGSAIPRTRARAREVCSFDRVFRARRRARESLAAEGVENAQVVVGDGSEASPGRRRPTRAEGRRVPMRPRGYCDIQLGPNTRGPHYGGGEVLSKLMRLAAAKRLFDMVKGRRSGRPPAGRRRL